MIILFLKLHGAAKNRQFMSNETSKNNEPDIVPDMDKEHRWNSTYDSSFAFIVIKRIATKV